MQSNRSPKPAAVSWRSPRWRLCSSHRRSRPFHWPLPMRRRMFRRWPRAGSFPRRTASSFPKAQWCSMCAQGPEVRLAARQCGLRRMALFHQGQQGGEGQLLDDDAELTKRIQALGISADKPVVVWRIRSMAGAKTAASSGRCARSAIPRSSSTAASLLSPAMAIPHQARRRNWHLRSEARRGVRDQEGGTSPAPRRQDHRDPRHARAARICARRLMAKAAAAMAAKHVSTRISSTPMAMCFRQRRSAKSSRHLRVSGCGSDLLLHRGHPFGFVTAVLNNAGIKARNYAGSMWDWSSADEKEYPLVTGAN